MDAGNRDFSFVIVGENFKSIEIYHDPDKQAQMFDVALWSRNAGSMYVSFSVRGGKTIDCVFHYFTNYGM